MKMQRVPMTIEEYHLLPCKPGWKCEYLEGEAHIQPRSVVALLIMPVRPFPVSTPCLLREVTSEDHAALIAASYEAFRDTCEYCDWPDEAIQAENRRNIEEFFAGRRGRGMPASRVAIAPSVSSASVEIIGAALIARDREGPNLDLLFVLPNWQRRGVATAMVSAAMNILHEAGEQYLGSGYHLANEPSIAWHTGFGFVEEPDLQIAKIRFRCATHELWRREQIGPLDSKERAQLEKECAYWKAQVETLHEIEDREGYRAVTPILRRRR